MVTKLIFCLVVCHGVTAFRSAPEVRLAQQGMRMKSVIPVHHSQLDEDLLSQSTDLDDSPLLIKPSNGSGLNRRSYVLGIAVGSLVTVAISAKMGILPTPDGFQYTDDLIMKDAASTMLGAVLGFVFVKFCTLLASRGILESRDSRKIIHTLSAPLYMVLWPLFSPAGRYFAACVPLVNAFRLYLAAKGDRSEADLANAVSRSGESKEALGGPFVYVLIMLGSILMFWTDNVVGITALCTMAAGDGMADLIGRRLGKNNKWAFAESKSVAGSVAFWISSSLCASAIIAWLSTAGVLMLPCSMTALLLQIILITGLCAVVELMPFGDDNWTVPISAAALTAIAFYL